MQTTPPATDSVEQVLDGRIYEIVDVALTAHKQEVAAMLQASEAQIPATIVQVLQQRGLIPPPIPLSHRAPHRPARPIHRRSAQFRRRTCAASDARDRRITFHRPAAIGLSAIL